jgi:hypothetical protein
MAVRDLPIIRVTLNYEEELEAHRVGFARASELGSTANHSSRDDKNLNYHEYIGQLAEAVGSEISVAKYFDITDFKPTVNTFKYQADIGSKIEVKWTKWKDGHLIIRQSDRSEDIAVLVVGKSPEYFLVGWIPIKHAKAIQNWSAANSNWWIKQADLNPMGLFLKSAYADTSL